MHLMDPLDTSIPYKQWCLEEAALRLSGNFPRHHIVIIKPTRTLFDHVSSFDNFVISNFVGSPKHVYRYDAILHLQIILEKISQRIKITPTHKLFKMLLKRQVEEDYLDDSHIGDTGWQFEYMSHKKKQLLFRWQKRLHLDLYPLTLIGFSKGCVVLNQFLYEFHYARRLEPNNQESGYIDRIKSMYWLDAAHPGTENVYVTSRAVLKTLKDLDIELHNHVSQYQTEDLKRPWIRRQWLEFTETLKQFNARLTTRIHDVSTDLTAHYNIFLNFMVAEVIRNVTTPPPPSPPPPPPHHPLPLPAAAYPPRQADQQQQTTPEGSEIIPQIIGVSLISPQTDPYLGIQLILRKPLGEPLSSSENSSDSDSSSDRNSQSDAQQPYSPDQNPCTSAQHPSTSAQVPSTSSQQPAFAENVTDSAEHPSTSRRDGRSLSADSFTVLMKKPNSRINFSEDLAAAEAFRTARYYKIETPMIATPSTNPLISPGICIYAPVIETYVPLVINSTKAATPRGSRVVVNRVDMPGTVASNMAQAAPEAFNRHANSGTIESQSAMQSQPNPTITQSQAAPWAVQPQSDPRVAQSQSTFVVTQTQAYPRAAQVQTAPRAVQPQSHFTAAQPQTIRMVMPSQAYSRAVQAQTALRAVQSQSDTRVAQSQANSTTAQAQNAPRAAQPQTTPTFMQLQAYPRAVPAQTAPRAVQPQSHFRAAQSQTTPRVMQLQADPRAQALTMPWDIQPQSEPMAVQSQSTSRAMLSQIAAQLQTDPLTVESQTAPSSMESNPIPIQPNLAILPYEEQPTPRVTRRSPRSRPQNRNTPYSGNGRSSSSCYNLRSLLRSHLLDQ